MDFIQAVRSMKSGQAVRTPRMHGYVQREDFENNAENASLFANGASAVFDLGFVPNPVKDPQDPPRAFRCEERRLPSGRTRVSVLEGSMELDAELLSELLAEDWDAFSLDDLVSAARSEKTGRW